MKGGKIINMARDLIKGSKKNEETATTKPVFPNSSQSSTSQEVQVISDSQLLLIRIDELKQEVLQNRIMMIEYFKKAGISSE